MVLNTRILRFINYNLRGGRLDNLDKVLKELERDFSVKVARAFEEAISDIKSDVVLKRVIEALERGDIEAAMDALNIDDAAFNNVRQQLTQAFINSGTSVMSIIKFDPPGETRATVRWNISNPDAEEVLSKWVGEKITNITEATKAAARSAMTDRYREGKGPRQIALDVVGRVNKVTKKREGGLLGLNAPQENAVSNMRAYLERGDLKKVLRMSKRDLRFDRSIEKLIREGKKPSKTQIDKWVGRYADKLLKLRGDTIARTETAAAVEQGRFNGFKQGMDAKGYPYHYANKKWRHGGGGVTPRHNHVAENETVVQGLLAYFTMPDGAQLLYPHDPDAPASHVINCTCSVLITMDWVRMRRDGII